MSDNSFKNKRIAKNTIVLYVRLIFTILVGLYTSRVILDALGVTDFGVYNLVGGFVTMFNAVQGGLVSASQRFLSVSLGIDNKNKLVHVFSTIFIIYIFLTAFAVILVETFGLYFFETHLNIPVERLHAAKWTFQLSIVALIATILGAPANALIISHERMHVFAYLSIIDTIAKLLISISIYYSGFDKLIFYSILTAIESVIIQIVNWQYCIKHFDECRIDWTFDWILIKEIYSFAIWSMMGGLAFIGYTQGVTVILGMFFAPATVAARGIAMQVQGVIKHFADNFQTAVYPQIIKSYSTGEYNYFEKLLLISSKYSYILLYLISLPVMLETDTILHLWLVEVPKDTSLFLRLVLLSVLFNAMTTPYEKAVHASGNIKNYSLTTSIIFLLIAPVSYLILKLGGAPYSVFIVQLIFTLIAIWIRMYMAKIIVQISIPDFIRRCIVPLIKISVVSLVIPCLLFIFLSDNVLRFFSVIFLSLISVIICTYLYGMNSFEKNIIKNIIFKKFRQS